ncbi:MAG: 2-oxoacid:acceptor oxidoreductase subunit alpha [Candidatus Kariarchaeaceae archaeon]
MEISESKLQEEDFEDKETLFNFLAGGAAGDGIMSAGQLFSRMMTRNSYYCHLYTEYPSLIRGGHNMVVIRVADKPIYCQVNYVDILLAINLETIETHIHKLTKGAAVIYDPRILRRKTVEDFERPDILWCAIPMHELARSINAAKIVQNTIGVAAAISLVNLPIEEFEDILKEMFANKPAISEINVKAADLGYDYVKDHFPEFKTQLEDQSDKGLITMTGNTAVAAGLIAGGISVYTGYPMSPATSLLETMVKYSKTYDYMVVQCEDEISAVTMSIGSNHAGGRSATGTSGGGMALMVEAIGLAGSAEIPLVVINVMRPGPSTGLPTWTNQTDLLFAIRMGQDVFPRIILAPGDIEETFIMSSEALNLAEEYQTPVIVLTDKWLGSSNFTLEPLTNEKIEIRTGKSILLNSEPSNDNYMRYEDIHDGVSTRAIPGLPKNMIFRSTGNEHDQYGKVNDSAPNRIQQMDKRMRKTDSIKKNLPDPVIYGAKPEESDVTILSWGSNKGIILDVLNRLKEYNISFVHTTYVWPFPSSFIKNTILNSKHTILIEQNFDAQFGTLIKQECLVDVNDQILRYDGRPFDPIEIASNIKKIIKDNLRKLN